MKIFLRMLTLLAVVLPLMAKSQSVGPFALNATGGSATPGGNTYEYALGQVAAGGTVSGPGIVITPGVLQPEFKTTGVSSVVPIVALQIFPNPVEKSLFLQPAFGGSGLLQYSLYDAAGRLVLRRDAILHTGSERQTLDLSAMAAGQYQLQLVWQSGTGTAQSAYKIRKIR